MKTLGRGKPCLDAVKGQIRPRHSPVVETTKIKRKDFGPGGEDQNKRFLDEEQIFGKMDDQDAPPGSTRPRLSIA